MSSSAAANQLPEQEYNAPKVDLDAQVEKYLWLVRQVASKLSRTMRSVDFDDLVGDGVFGLMKAIQSFDTNRGVKFETYATPVIRGSMLNGLRSLDWIPERKRTKTRELQRAMDQFQITHGRAATYQEIAEQLEISVQEIHDIMTDLGNAYLLSLDQPASSSTEDERTIIETVEDKELREPAIEYQFEEELRLLKEAINQLPERECQLITLHYVEAKSFEEIATSMNVSKQRISQIHAKAIEHLRISLNVGSDLAIGTILEGAFLF